MKWRAVIVVVLLVAIVAAVIIGFFWSGDKTQFRPQIRAVMAELNAGKSEQVYKDSSYFFKRTLNQDAFVDMTSRLSETLGPFIRITDIIEVSRSKSLAGRVGEVTCMVEFREAVTEATFGFHRGKDKKWRLLLMSVNIPEALAAKAAALEVSFDRIHAPRPVIEKVSEILGDIRDGKSDEVWQQASKPFRDAISSERFAELNASYEEQLGKFTRVLMVESGQHPNKTKAKVDAVIEYEKVRTQGQFTFIKFDNKWQLSFFRPLIPEPVVGERQGKRRGGGR